MGKVDRLHNRVELLAALFLALGIVLANSPNPARRPSIPPPPDTIMSLYGDIGSILNEDVLPPPLFLSKNIIYLWPSTTNIITKSKLNTMQFCPVFWHKSCETIPLRTRVGLLSSPIYQMEVKMKEMRERPDTPQATPISTYTHTIPFKEQVSQKLHALNRKK